MQIWRINSSSSSLSVTNIQTLNVIISADRQKWIKACRRNCSRTVRAVDVHRQRISAHSCSLMQVSIQRYSGCGCCCIYGWVLSDWQPAVQSLSSNTQECVSYIVSRQHAATTRKLHGHCAVSQLDCDVPTETRCRCDVDVAGLVSCRCQCLPVNSSHLMAAGYN